MKAFGILALLALSFAAHASSKQPDQWIRSSNDTTFTCSQYTSNTIVDKEHVTDNDPIKAKTVVIQTKEGFIINKGTAFDKKKILTNNQLGSVGDMAGDPTTLLLKKEDVPGSTYFITYVFGDPKSSEAKDNVGPLKSLIVMAGCVASN